MQQPSIFEDESSAPPRRRNILRSFESSPYLDEDDDAAFKNRDGLKTLELVRATLAKIVTIQIEFSMLTTKATYQEQLKYETSPIKCLLTIVQ
jgi:hypothetical protein